MPEASKTEKKPQRIQVLVQLRERIQGLGPHVRDVQGELLGGGSLLAMKNPEGKEAWYPVSCAWRIDPVVAP